MRYGAAWNAGGVFDWARDDALGASVAQIRAKTSITLDAQNEVGAWGAVSITDDNGKRREKVQAVDQVNLFYRHLFSNGWDLDGWLGWRSDPSSGAIGADATLPLDDYWAVTGGGHYAFEGDSWNAYVGLILHLGPHAHERYLGELRHLPYLPVADNSSMTLSRDR
jgi:hypothetical protein